MSHNDAPPRSQPRPQPGPNVRAPYRSAVRHRARRLPAYIYWRRRALVILGAVTLVMVSYYGVTLGFALNNQSYGVSLQARFAEWGRQHGFGGIVTWAESEYNRLHPAKVGGAPSTSGIGKGTVNVTVTGTQPLPVPTNLQSPAAVPFAPAAATIPGTASGGAAMTIRSGASGSSSMERTERMPSISS